MTTRPDVPDLAVDELRRRARRRLVGAIVLALAAAVLLPLLLENEPKPLGEDVSIQIPPIDSGKFINPLSSGKALDPKAKGSVGMSKSGAPAVAPPPADAPATVPPATNTKSAENEQRTSGSSATPAPEAAPPTAGPETKVADAATGASDVKPAPAAPAPRAESTLDDAKATATAKTDAAKSGAAFVVQVAAFSDRYGARSLVTKLKRGGFPGYTEEVTTDKGTLHRVRVGPYASREAAATALAKLKAAGFNGMIAHVG